MGSSKACRMRCFWRFLPVHRSVLEFGSPLFVQPPRQQKLEIKKAAQERWPIYSDDSLVYLAYTCPMRCLTFTWGRREGSKRILHNL